MDYMYSSLTLKWTIINNSPKSKHAPKEQNETLLIINRYFKSTITVVIVQSKNPLKKQTKSNKLKQAMRKIKLIVIFKSIFYLKYINIIFFILKNLF